MRVLTLFLAMAVFVGGVVSAHCAWAARSESIAVVVNEDAITMSDVNDRMALIIASSGLPNKKDVQEKLLPQIIGSLVEEQVRLQEARRLDLNVSPEDIAQGFAAVAQQNNMSAEEFRSMITRGGLNIRTLEAQIRAQIAWSKVVQAKLRPQVVVSDSDVDSYLERLNNNTGKPEYLVSEIFLPSVSAQEESETQQLAYKLVQEIRSGQAPFFKVAQQFSQSAGAPQGGDLGWIAQGQLQQELDEVLARIPQGQVSDPIRSASGYHILNVRDQRLIAVENLPGREQVMGVIGMQRLERLQRRYLMDLKSAAFIENRLAQ
ncbi:MAG TPA: peptidylprolyl isomerase [Alphaproteobacteria bacterium]|nr:peptidylprolyl isomerase [Alphaproteobacteria bacterium]USO05250.1 MAG: peptidylprolyl isomerase [Rhodospirillales bacterium]HOO81936.1 peptidylprolyl isomerase [Alphaproteobacteria bacterium]